MNRLVSTRIARLGGDDLREPRGRRGGRKVMVAGMVVAVSRRNTQNGPMASVLLDDKTGRIEATLFSQVYERFRDEIASDRVLVVEGTLVRDEYRGGLGIRADGVSSLEAVRIARAAVLELALDEAWVAARGNPEHALAALREILEPARGGACEVRLRYRRCDAEAVLRLGEHWAVRPTDILLRQAQRLLGADAVTVSFAPAVREPGAAAVASVH
jgi:DNA polymerase-3 subunit alpha